ncbi:hypothetical protein [Nannocystis radixulma]|uniref:Uncharacterized protein n=1 Tax=Nannocystis radixulma TaxID=2995305 RepID=A0ABT5BJM6_9BACT|nr:hypothetical protein [Nannocystis radixulma]MDC0674338.1 hypothetical protein [Nannocystis radixulma]
MTDTPARNHRIALLGLTVAGIVLGAGLRASESRAHASSLECPDDGILGGDFVEVRRISGTGDIESQAYWRSNIELSLRTNKLGVFDAVFDPAHPPFDLDLAPEAAP